MQSEYEKSELEIVGMAAWYNTILKNCWLVDLLPQEMSSALWGLGGPEHASFKGKKPDFFLITPHISLSFIYGRLKSIVQS